MGKPKLKVVPVPGRSGSDTVKLWERYKRKSLFWRSLTLLQFPISAVLIVSSIYFISSAETIVDVPDKPEPGTYSVTKLPDAEFISVAQSVLNLIETYQPYTANNQFRTARKFLWEPALSDFDRNYLSGKNGALKAIRELGKSQQFRMDAARVRIQRFDDHVVVKLPGFRYKLLQNRHLRPELAEWYIKMTTIPRNLHNEYGIVITDMKLREGQKEPSKKGQA